MERAMPGYRAKPEHRQANENDHRLPPGLGNGVPSQNLGLRSRSRVNHEHAENAQQQQCERQHQIRTASLVRACHHSTGSDPRRHRIVPAACAS